MQEPSINSKLIKHLICPARDAMFAVLSVFSFLLGALHGRRGESDVGIWAVSRRVQEGRSKDERRVDEAVVMDAYGSMRASNHVRSWRVLADWLKSRGDHPEDYAWLSSRIASWADQRPITRLTEERVARLLALKRTGEVLDVVAHRLTVDPHFRPKSAADTLSLAQLAARGGGMPRVARALLSDFSVRFEGDPRVTVAESLRRHLSSHAPARKQSA